MTYLYDDDLTDEYFDDEYDHCNECRSIGDDYYYDENGDSVSACLDCPFNTYKEYLEDY